MSEHDIASAIDRLTEAFACEDDHHPQSSGEPDTIVSALARLAHNVGRVASGGTSGPDGLEGLAMSISRHSEPSLSESVSRVASAIEELASAVQELAPARSHTRPAKP